MRNASALDALAAGIGADDVEPLAALADGLDGLLDGRVGLVSLDVDEEEIGRVGVVPLARSVRGWGTTRSRSC